jgi:hypothetical protein
MMSIWNDVKDRFYPFITLPLFVFGFIVLLIGITTGVKIPTQDINLTSEPNLRIIAIMTGLGSILLSLILNLIYKNPNIPNPPEEWKQPLLIRAANLTEGQSDILQYIREKTEHLPFSKLGEIELGKKFGKGGSEIYYRLEQLRLLGLIAKENLGGPGKNHYRVSESYRKALAVNPSS